MAYELERSGTTDRDLEDIFDFLYRAALEFGEPPAEAFDRAAARLLAMEAAMHRLAETPHQGTRRPDLGSSIRSVTKERAIFYFDVDDAARRLRILAIFFGGEDHQRRMLLRLLGGA